MKRLLLALSCAVFITGCTPIEKQVYNTIVASKALLDSIRTKHPECATATTTLCNALKRATASKDTLIDSIELYCASKSFDQNGGSCTPPNKSDPAYQQVADKLQAALAGYKQAEVDLKGVIGQ